MINHGIPTGGLFLIIGMIYERRHTRLIDDFGGIAKVMPVYTLFTMIIVFSSIGLPGTNGFVGEILILMGLFKANLVLSIIGASGVIFGAAYMLWMSQRVLFGKITHEENKKLKDVNFREFITLLSIVILILWIGVYPKHFTGLAEATTTHLTETVNRGKAPVVPKVEKVYTIHGGEAGAPPMMQGGAHDAGGAGLSVTATVTHGATAH